MNRELLDFQVNNTCEAYGCFEKAATTIKVRVGHLGIIPLDLCANCVKKFDEIKEESKQNIVTNQEEAIEE